MNSRKHTWFTQRNVVCNCSLSKGREQAAKLDTHPSRRRVRDKRGADDFLIMNVGSLGKHSSALLKYVNKLRN